MVSNLKLFAILLIYLLTSSLNAHPHTFIDVYTTLKENTPTSSKVNFTWKLDEMTSVMLILDIDQNGDGKIDRAENKFIYENYFTIFEPYNYYTYIKHDKKELPFPKVENFQVTIKENRVLYSFDIKIPYDIREVSFEFGDSDFYIAMILKKEFVKAQNFQVEVQGVDNDYYYGYKMNIK